MQFKKSITKEGKLNLGKSTAWAQLRDGKFTIIALLEKFRTFKQSFSRVKLVQCQQHDPPGSREEGVVAGGQVQCDYVTSRNLCAFSCCRLLLTHMDKRCSSVNGACYLSVRARSPTLLVLLVPPAVPHTERAYSTGNAAAKRPLLHVFLNLSLASLHCSSQA
ncbi:hypothetical protein CBL_06735 [Carabus blaptoides fortunei]